MKLGFQYQTNYIVMEICIVKCAYNDSIQKHSHQKESVHKV